MKLDRLVLKVLREAIFTRAGYRCEKCGEIVTWQNGEMDEIVPRGRGGKQTMDNCQLLCHACHMEKHGRKLKFTGRK